MGIYTLSTIVTYSDSTISTYEIVGQLSAGQISNEAIGISVGSLVSSIGESAFYENAKLSSVIFADGTSISSIGNYAFYGCDSLSNVDVPATTTTIGEGAFQNCTAISSLSISLSTNEIGRNAFASNEHLTVTFSSRDYGQVIGLGNYPWGLKFSQVNAYPTIPSLSNLGLSTMMDGSSFYSDIPLSAITKDAFYNCSSLNSIKVLSASSIEDETFMGCDNAYEIALPPLLSIGNIFGDDRSTLSVMALSVQNETQSIGTSLSGLAYLANFALPSSLTALEMGALSGTSIAQLSVDSKILKAGCFLGMQNLQSLSIEATTDLTDDFGLSTLSNLNSIFWRSSDGSHYRVGTAFYGTPCNNIVFSNDGECLDAIGLQLSGCINVQAINLSNAANLTSIYDGLFTGCQSLVRVFVPSTVSAILENSLCGCTSLDDNGFAIPDQVLSIWSPGISHFYQVPQTIAYVGPSAFANATLDIQDAVLTGNQNAIIEDGAFSGGCTLQSIAISCTESIPPQCFFGNAYLQTVSISSAVGLAVGPSAFMNCGSLNTISLGVEDGHAIEVSSLAFAYCGMLESASLKEMSSIGPSAFIGCQSMTSIELDQNLTGEIGNHAFKDCGLQTIQIPPSAIYGTAILAENVNLYQVTVGCTYGEFREHQPSFGLFDITNKFDSAQIISGWNSVATALLGSTTSNIDVTFNFTDVQLNSSGKIYSKYECLSVEDNTLVSVITSYVDFNDFTQKPALPSDISAIAGNAFSTAASDDRLTAISLNNVTVAGTGVLSGASYMTSVSALALQSIPPSAFAYDRSLMATQFMQASNISNYAFYDCDRLPSIVAINATSIGDGAFMSCASLASCEFGALTSIGLSAFSGCSALRSISLGSISAIQPYTFQNCSSLESLAIPTTVDQPLGVGSLKSTSHQLKVIFDGRQNTDAILQTPDFFNNQCSSQVSTAFFTMNNSYEHPSFVTVSSSSILSVYNNGFECTADGNGKLKLLSVDDNFYGLFDSSIEICSSIGYIAGLNSGKTTEVKIANDANYILSDWQNCVADDVFSGSNAPSLNTIRATGVKYSDVSSGISSFYSDKCGSNPDLTVVLQDGIYYSGGFIEDTDPFLSKDVDGSLVIYGIDDNKVSDISAKIIRGNSISAYAFQSNSFAPDINKRIVQLEVPDIANLTSIQSYAFTNNSTLSSIISLGSKITDIGDDAFTGSGIATILLPSSLTANTVGAGVGGYGLNKVEPLTSLSYEDGIVRIAPSAMIGCQGFLSRISLPATLQSIGDYAFAEIQDVFPRITNLNLSSATHLLSIGDYAFYNAVSSLAENKLVLPPSLTSIGEGAFAYNKYAYTQVVSSLQPHSMEGGSLKHIGPSAFMYNRFKDVDLGDTLSSIGDGAFAYPKYKFGIHVPGTIEHIGANAFKNNVILNPNNLKANIASIDVDFNDIPTVLGIEVSSDFLAENKQGFSDGTVVSATVEGSNPFNNFAFVYNGMMNFCPQDMSVDIMSQTVVKLDESCVEATIPVYTKGIAPSAFMGCTSIEVVKGQDGSIPYVLGNVEDFTFYGCDKLSAIQLSTGTSYVGKAAFYNCQSISSFYSESALSDYSTLALSSIGASAFMDCTSIESFCIGPKLAYLGEDAFARCSSLTSIGIAMLQDDFLDLVSNELLDTSLTIEDAVSAMFSNVRDDGKCLVNFLDASYTNNGIIKLDNSLFGTYAYSGSKVGISSILSTSQFEKQPFINLSGVGQVDQFVFKNATNLHSISFLPKDSLEVVGDYAFYGCGQLGNFNSGNLSCSHVGCYAFANCNQLIKMSFDFNALSCIGQGAFYNTSLNTLQVIRCPADSGINTIVRKFKDSIGYDAMSNPNPLELPNYCNIVFIDVNGTTLGKYDYLFNDLTNATVDTNRNAIVFVDKARESICPLLLVKPHGAKRVAALIENSFHANIVGKWK